MTKALVYDSEWTGWQQWSDNVGQADRNWSSAWRDLYICDRLLRTSDKIWYACNKNKYHDGPHSHSWRKGPEWW